MSEKCWTETLLSRYPATEPPYSRTTPRWHPGTETKELQVCNVYCNNVWRAVLLNYVVITVV